MTCEPQCIACDVVRVLVARINDLPERARNNQLDREHIEMLVEKLQGKAADLARELAPNVLFEEMQ